MKDPDCVNKMVKIAPHDYSKENYLATFTPQKQLTPEQIFWSDDLLKMKAKALKENAKSAKPITTMTVTENEKGKHHYKELYDSIKLTHAKTIEKITSLLNEIENLKAQLKEKMKCATVPAKKPKVLTPEIVEEARVEKPLDSLLVYACCYTKHFQELLEYVIGTCPKDFNARDKKLASTSFRVKGATSASGSKPRSNTKKDRTLPAKSAMKKVEDHHRSNNSSVK
nr:hypothetical protein [Tanacetum cinerariifolium]